MRPLSGRFREILDKGNWEDHYQDKFRARRALMLAAVNRDWSFRECELVFLDIANPGSELWLASSDGGPLSGRESLKRLRTDYEAASTYRRNNPSYRTAADARAYIGELRALARDWPWHGTSGRTDRDVLRFAHETATWVGCASINLATRDVALGAGVSRQTASISLRRLCDAGWLEKIEPAGKGLAPLFRLARPSSKCAEISHMVSSGGENYMAESCAPTEPDHEVWVKLGKAAMDLHSVLNDTPMSGREAARRARLAESTARLHFHALAGCGLAVKQDRGWVKGGTDLDRVASAQGWVGLNSKRTRRRLRYQAERRAYKKAARERVPVLQQAC